MKGLMVVNRDRVREAFELSMNAGVAYLALAAGTRRDNRTTQWSTTSIIKRTSLGRTIAQRAVDQLLSSGLIIKHQGGKTPVYELAGVVDPDEYEDHDFIGNKAFLPNALVTGAGNEVPPIERLRQTQDVSLIELLIDLYADQNFTAGNGLLSLRREYSAEKIAESGPFCIWGFNQKNTFIAHGEELYEKYAGDRQAMVQFWERRHLLEELGLIVWSDVLMDNIDGGVIHHLCGDVSGEDEAGELAREVSNQLLPELYEYPLEGFCYVAPIPKHIPEPVVVGNMRTRYRAITGDSKQWFKEVITTSEHYVGRYQSMIDGGERVSYFDNYGT